MGATMSDRGWQVWIRSGCYSRTWHRLWPQSWKLQLMSILVGEFPFKSHFKLVKLFWLKWTTRNRLPCSFSLKLMLRKLVEIGAAWLGSLAFQKGPEVFSDQGRIWVFAKRSRFQPINYFHRSGETILCVILHVFWSLLKSSEVFRFLFNIYIYMYIYIYTFLIVHIVIEGTHTLDSASAIVHPGGSGSPISVDVSPLGLQHVKNSGSTGGIIGCDDCDEFLYKKY